MADRTNRMGKHIGDYYLRRRLGGGGFGDVYLGEHVHTHTLVAVKVLQTHLTRSDELKEFINEARTFRLRHPHIIQLLDFGIDSDDVPYLVMEYASHGTLRDKHPKGTQVPLSTILSYVVPLASALQYAHDQHLIHRDVKPENMLLGAHNDVLLSDFGIVAVAHSSSSLSTQEGIGGTLPYMAPEQIQGKPRPASDQYALGVVVYEWLTGTRPFKGTAVEVAVQHGMTPPPPLREHVPMLSTDVEQVVLTALAKEPKQRFASIMAFAEALEQASEKRTTSPFIALPPMPVAATLLPPTKPVAMVAPLDSEHISPDGLLHPVLSPLTALPKAAPAMPLLPSRKKRSVRPLVFFLISLVISGSIGLAIMTTQISAYNMHMIATATVRAIPTVAAGAYNNAVATNGIMSGFDAQHTRNNPFERVLNSTTVSGLKTAWTSNSTSHGIFSSPVVANGIVFVGSVDGKLYAYKAGGCDSGKITCPPLWTSNPTGYSIFSSPAVTNGIIYIGSVDGKLYAYKAGGCGSGKTTCPPLWTSNPTDGAISSSPAVANGVVYVGSYDGKLYAYKAGGCGSGKTTCPPLWTSNSTDGVITSSPAVANGVVYIGSYDHKLYAYKVGGCGSGKTTCPPLWTSNPTDGSITTSSPAVANDVVYIGSVDHKLYAYKARGCGSGKTTCPPLWTSNPTDGAITSSPAVANGVVYVGSVDHKLYAYKAGGCGSGKTTCPPLWTSNPTDGAIISSPAVANGVVYVGSDDHKLYAYKAGGCGSGKTTCPPLWTSNPTDGAITSSPAVANGVVYVGSDDGKLYTFHL